MSTVLSGYLALGSAVSSGTFTEISGGGYYRQPLSFLTSGSTTLAVNAGSVTFGPSSNAWANIAYFGLFDSVSGGTLIAYWARAPANIVTTGQTLFFAANTMLLQFATGFFSGSTLSSGTQLCTVSDPLLTTVQTMLAGSALQIISGQIVAQGDQPGTVGGSGISGLGLGSVTFTGGAGISVLGSPITGSGGTVTLGLTSTGVAAGTYANPTLAINANGFIVAVASGSFSVTGTNGVTISGSPISNGGALVVGLATSGVTAGYYTNPIVTVNQFGLITGAANGSASVNSVLSSVGIQGQNGISVNGSPVSTTSGTMQIAIAGTGVVPGTYTVATVVVNPYGQILSITEAAPYGYAPLGSDGQIPAQYLPSFSTLNASDKSTGVTLSNGNLTAASGSTTTQAGVRSTTSRNTGKWYFEFTVNAGGAGHVAVGLANSSFTITGGPGGGADNNAVVFFPQYYESVWTANASVVGDAGEVEEVDGSICSVCVDINNKLIWVSGPAMRTAGYPWNNNTTANPVTGVGGAAFPNVSGPFFLLVQFDNTNEQITLNVGATTFNQSVPSGFSSWG